MALLVNAFFVLLAAFGASAQDTVIRNTSSGKVQGFLTPTTGNSIEKYFGIPYAAPPIGELRWRPPKRHQGWANTEREPLNATKHGAGCPQIPQLGTPEAGWDEDCLFLNIYVPQKNESDGLSAVMVFVHGGGFSSGYSDFYDATTLSLVGNVILVTLNYRLGVLGFLSTGDSQSPGNYGLLDQRAALEWVQENIENFGGDKGKVTLFGHSAGSAAALMQAISPMNNPVDGQQLFKRVIAQSGTPYGAWTYNTEPSYYANKLIRNAGCPTFSTVLGVNCLRGLNFSTILELQETTADLITTGLIWVPATDGTFLPDTPVNMMASDELRAQVQSRYEFLLGVTDMDINTNLFLNDWYTGLTSEEEFTAAVEEFMGLYFANPEKVTEAAKYNYLDWSNYPPASDRWKFIATDVVRDVEHLVPSVRFSNLASAADGFDSGVFYYFFIQEPSAAMAAVLAAYPRTSPSFSWRNGAIHAEELMMVFGLPLSLPDSPDSEKALTSQLITYWTNFAKTGDPNIGNPSPTDWPKYDAVNQEYMSLGTKEAGENLTRVDSHLAADKVVFWTKEVPLLDVGDGFNDSVNIPTTPVSEPPEALVNTDKGYVKGKHIRTESYFVDRFVGIPYAEPPVGVLRFKPTEQNKAWDGVLDCDGELTMDTVLATACATVDINGGVVGTEDCLYLNVWVPGGVNATRDRLLPVMVWIHGGTYASTSWTGVSNFNDMEQLVAHGNVIGVSINYRMGPLGFLSTADENSPGNAGYLDQVAALTWIQTNIVNFGGDAAQVTVFGQGVGAAAVSLHMVSPISKDLFLRGIAQSGVVPAQQTWQREPLYWAQKLAGNVGCPTQDTRLLVGCLRNQPVDAIVQGVETEPLDHGGRVYNPWGGVIDGYFLTKDPISSLGDSSDKDFLVGFNDMDGYTFAMVDFPGINDASLMSETDLKLASTRFTPYVPDYVANSVAFTYTDWEDTPSDGDWPKLAIANLYTDSMFASTTSWTANARFAKNGTGRTYVYRFSHRSKSTNEDLSEPEWKGADFGEELPYVFGDAFRDSDSDEKSLSQAIMTYWTNFVWSGNPNSPNGADTPTQWPEYTKDKRTLDLNINTVSGGDESAILINYRGEFVQFWSETALTLWSLPLVSCPSPTVPTPDIAFNPDPDSQVTPVTCPEMPLVRATQYGCVEGYLVPVSAEVALERYFGIQYAAAPIGQLRFAPPLPPAAWTGVNPAKNFSKICPQSSAFDDTTMSEDCLYLNIYVPRQNPVEEPVNANLAVMIWIHGGAFMTGDGTTTYRGDILATFGNVIVVTLNYRLGSFGFLTTDDDAASGNYGLLDQQFAMKWTKNNIAAFGGDPDRITIFGESAGGQSVLLQTLSPTNDGLGISRAVIQSYNNYESDLRQLETAKKVAELASCDVTSGTAVIVECLRALDTSALLQAQALSGQFFYPNVDGSFLPAHPSELINEDRVKNWKHLMGANSGEGAFFWSTMQSIRDEESFFQWIRFFLSTYGWRLTLIEQQYSDYDDPDFFDNQQKLQLHASKAVGDRIFVAPMLQRAEEYSKIGSDVFLYYFTHPHQAPALGEYPTWLGAAHAAELWYMFGSVMFDESASDEEKALSFNLMQYWSNFAKTGDPNGGSAVPVQWPRFGDPDASARNYIRLDLGNGTYSAQDLRPEENAFWNDLMVAQGEFCLDDSEPVPDPTTATSPAPDPNSPEVETQEGSIRGTRVKDDLVDVEVYLGIPYAKPPLGDLRFAKTEKIEGWTTLLDATVPKPPCIQYHAGSVVGGENCLYLDVFKPFGIESSTNTLVPIMVWIHGSAEGGSFWSGGGSPGWSEDIETINPTYLSNFGNVIVVRPNYRLGSLGFLTTQSNAISGNYGLYDLKEALMWTVRNARVFGGDPGKITLIGEGSGAAMAELLGILPSTKEHVKKVIAQSGSVFAPWLFCGQESCGATASAIATSTGCDGSQDTQLLTCLRQLNAEDVVNAFPLVSIESNTENNYNTWGMWRLRKDGDLIPETSLEELFSASDVDLISGVASHEFYRYIEAAYVDSTSRRQRDIASMTILQRAIFDTHRFLYGSEVGVNSTYSVLSHAYTDWKNPNDEDVSFESAVEYYNDLMYAVPSSKSIESKGRATSGKVFQYVLSQPLATSSDTELRDWVGARQGDAISYTFGIPFTKANSYSDEDRRFSDAVISYWTNFAWNGDPNNAIAMKTWMEYTPDTKHYLNLNDRQDLGPTTNYNVEKRALWQEVIPTFAPEAATTTIPTTGITPTTSLTTSAPGITMATVPPIGSGLGLSLTPEGADTAIYTLFAFCLIFGLALFATVGYLVFKWMRNRSKPPGLVHANNTFENGDTQL